MSTHLIPANSLSISDGVDAYMQRISSIPILSTEDERHLAVRLHEEQDLDAARQLIMSHLRFVVHIAKSYHGYGLPLADLIQEGNIGLMKAVKRFDPNVGVRLISFAVHWIKAEIHEFVIRNWRIVKIATTKAQRKLFFNLRSMKKRLGWFNDKEVQAVANDLGVSTKDVLQMESRLNAHDTAYDTPDTQHDQDSLAPEQYLEDQRYNPANLIEAADSEQSKTTTIQAALAQLDRRSRDIIQQRWLFEKKATLHDLADKYQISAERVRQLEQQAMSKLKTSLV